MPDEPAIKDKNFHGSVRFRPASSYAPQSKDDVLRILRDHRERRIRVLGSAHSWSELAASDDVMLSLGQLDQVEEIQAGEPGWVRVQAGCTMKQLLRELRRQNLTLPTVGQVTEQTVAGAVATATHGSGAASLSAFVIAVEVAAYDAAGEPCCREWTPKNPEFAAACCSLGCIGVILTVTLRCVSSYLVFERLEVPSSIREAVSKHDKYPLQEFGIVPQTWRIFAFRRCVARDRSLWRHIHSYWWRAVRLILVDVAFHASVKAVLFIDGALRHAGQVKANTTRLLLRAIPTLLGTVGVLSLGSKAVADSNAILTRAHHLFRHLEMEVFVPASRIEDAMDLVRYITTMFADGHGVLPSVWDQLEAENLLQEVQLHRGSYLHHYPIYCRRVDAEPGLIAMTSGGPQAWYAIGFFTYNSANSDGFAAFRKYARIMALALVRICGARLHWGKYFPLDYEEIEPSYPGLTEFRAHCASADPHGVFQNDFTARVLGFPAALDDGSRADV